MLMQHCSQHKAVDTQRKVGTDLFFSCNFNGSGGNLRRKNKKTENSQPERHLLLISNFMIRRLKYADFAGKRLADKFSVI